MSKFNSKEFQEKITKFQKTMEDLAEKSKKLEAELEKPTLKKPQDHLPKIEKEKPINFGVVNSSVKWSTNNSGPIMNTWWLDDQINTAIDGAETVYNAKGEGASVAKPAYIPPTYSQNTVNNFKDSWKKVEPWKPVSQDFGTGPFKFMDTEYFYDSASFNEYEEEPSNKSKFNSQLIATVIHITLKVQVLSIGAELKKHGKEGHAIVFQSSSYSSKNKAYVWWIGKSCWVEVEYADLMDHWSMVQKQNMPKFNNDYLSIGYTEKYMPPPSPKVEGLPEPPPIDWGTPVVAKTIAEQITKVVKQKTKPSKPIEGLAWYNVDTGWPKLYQNGKWVDIKPSDINEYSVLSQKKAVGKMEANQAKKTETGYWFRANCSNWHKVVNPDKTVIKSVNGKHTWFYSSESAESEYNCAHDNKRAMPCFTSDEKKAKLEEIHAKQNGQIDEQYYVQAGQNSLMWEEVHAKQTIKIGNRAFHHNSGNKVWYICLNYNEMIEAKMHIQFSTNLAEDLGNIFIDAIPVNKFGYAWFMDGTVNKKSMKNKAEEMQQQLLDIVQMKADELYYKKNGQQKKQPVQKDIALESHYQLSPSDYPGYLSIFSYIHDNEYSYQQFKNKACQAHKYFMHDLKLAMKKKDKKRFEICVEHLELLQEKFNEVEAWNAGNLGGAYWLKPLSKVQDMWNYHFDNPFGVEKE